MQYFYEYYLILSLVQSYFNKRDLTARSAVLYNLL